MTESAMSDVHDKKIQFLSNAITDLSNWIRFLDAKIALMFVFTGVMVTGLLVLRKELVILELCTTCMILQCFICVLFATAMISLLFFLWQGYSTVQARIARLDYNSRCFFKPCVYNFDRGFYDYADEVESMSAEEVEKNMAAELYKLNAIFLKK